jgi:pimeloyl-ACP methyl ester carboxylesterase
MRKVLTCALVVINVLNLIGFRLHRFPEGKHNIHLRFAKEFNDVVSEFLSQS